MFEKKAWYVNGFLALLIDVALLALAVFCFVGAINDGDVNTFRMIGAFVIFFVFLVLTSAFVIVQPNQAKNITFFGRYLGTIRENGFWLTVPFTVQSKVSLRIRNFNSETLKVNDAEGNPIEIAAVVVFKVVDAAKATFDVDNYETFVQIQSEAALRHVATKYPYDLLGEDDDREHTHSLRGNADEVAGELLLELQSRLSHAGVDILETRLTHLAYSAEIASAMLQRQQAQAIIAARQKIVEGAVGMVNSAIRRLEESGLELDDERKAAMVNNLMVAIVSDRSASPVINTGSLY